MKRDEPKKAAFADYSGCTIHGNTWIKIGLSKSQAARLRRAAKELLRPEYRSSGRAAWYLLNAAIVHLPVLAALIQKEGKGEDGFEMACERTSRAVLRQLN